MKAYLIDRDVNPAFGILEWWQAEDGKIFEVDFNVHVRQTTVYPYDMEKDRVEHWTPLLVQHKDMTGGRAMRKLGYELIEDYDGNGTSTWVNR